MLKTILGWLFVIILVLFIAFAPDTAAALFVFIGKAIAAIVSGFIEFFKALGKS